MLVINLREQRKSSEYYQELIVCEILFDLEK